MNWIWFSFKTKCSLANLGSKIGTMQLTAAGANFAEKVNKNIEFPDKLYNPDVP
jgi:hypothetical protein